MRVKLIRLLFMAILAMGTTTACFDPMSQDVAVNEVRKGRRFTAETSLSALEYEVQTKSSYTGAEDAVRDWNLFIFEANPKGGDSLLVAKYYKSYESIQNGDGDIEFNVRLDTKYSYYAVANVGNLTGLSSLAPGATLPTLKNVTAGLNIASNGLPMTWHGQRSFTRTDCDNGAKLNVQFKRMVSKYTIVVDRSALSVWSFTVTDVKLYGNKVIKPFKEDGEVFAASSNDVGQVDYATSADISNMALTSNSAAVFYPLENWCGNYRSTSDSWDKVPSGDNNVVNSKYPTYVELTALCELNDNSGVTKQVKYRFFLGNDQYNNYDVERNKSFTVTFRPDDETIQNGHNGNWKIDPGNKSATRVLAFNYRTTPTNRFRIKAGTDTSVHNIIRTVGGLASNFDYIISSTSSNVHLKNISGSAVDYGKINLSTMKLAIDPGIETQSYLKIRSIDRDIEQSSSQYVEDYLYLDIYNAYFEVVSSPGPQDPWEWNATGSGNGKTIQVKTTVGWTVTVPDGWAISPSSYTSDGSEQTQNLTVYPTTTSTYTGPGNEEITLTFHAQEGIGDVPVKVYRKFKPLAKLNNDIVDVTLTWDCDQGSSVDKTVSVTVNDGWTLAQGSGDWSHWYMSEAVGEKTGDKTITFHPVTTNDNTTALTATATVTPARGGEARTITLVHSAAQPRLMLLDSFDDWSWKQSGSGAAKTVHVSSNITWTAVISDTENWNISYDVAAGTITVYPKVNNTSTTTAKTATVTASGTGVSNQQTGTRQTPYPSVTIPGLVSDRIEWQYNDVAHVEYGVTSVNSGWVPEIIGSSASHFHVEKNSAGTGFIVYPNTMNDTNADIEATLKVKSDDADATNAYVIVTLVHKKQGPYFYIQSGSEGHSWTWKQGGSGNYFSVVLGTNITYGDWGFNLVGTDASKFQADRDGNTIKVYPKTNNADDEVYSCELMFDGTNVSVANVPFSIGKHPVISISPANATWAWNDGSSVIRDFIVTSNTGDWSISKTGTDKDSFDYTKDGNTIHVYPTGPNSSTTHDNVATITVTDNDADAGASASASLTHYKQTTFNVTPTSWPWIGTDQTPKSFTVEASGSWSVTTIPSDYELTTPASGSGNGSFSVRPKSPNNTYSDRTAQTMVVTSGSETRNITLQQLAKEKVYQEVYFEVSGTSNFYFHDANYYSAEIVGRYDGDQYDTIADVSDEVDWSYSGEFSPYVESATGNYRVQVYNTTTSSLTGKVSASFSGGEYAGHWVGATSDDQSVSVNAYPYVSASDVNIGWNNTSSHSYDNVSTNENLYEVSGFGSWFTSSSIYSWRASANNDSSPRSSVITVKVRAYDYIASGYVYESDTFTITQDGKPQSYTHTAAYIEIYLDDYSIDEGSTTKATAYLYTGEYTDSNPSASNDPDDYPWSSSDITSTVSGQFTSSKSSVASVSGRTVSGNSPGTAVIGTSYVPSGYNKVFDTNPASLTVNAATPVPEFSYWRYYDLEVSLNAYPEDPNTIAAAGGTSQLSATATWKRVKVYTDGSEPEPYETGSCNSITDSRFSVTRTDGSTEFSYDNGTVSVGSNTSTSTRSATFTATFTIGSGLGQASNSDDAKVTQEGAVVMNTYTAAYTVVSVGDTDLKVNETTSVTATLYVGTFTGPATSAPTSFDVYTWNEVAAVKAVSSNTDVFDKVSGTWTAKKAGTAKISAVVDYEKYHKHFEDRDVKADVTVTEVTITYGDFKVTVSPESISKGESSFASATIQKYVDGEKVGDPIDVTSLTMFSTSSSLVNKKGSRQFEWNGVGIMDYDVTIYGELSNGTYGTHSGDAKLTVEKEKYPVLFAFDEDSYVVASDAAVTNTCNFSVKVTYSDGSEDYVGSGLIPWSDISINTYGNAFFAGDGDFMAVCANSSTEARLFYKGDPKMCTATLTSQNPYELIGINPDISSGEGELYIGFEAEYQYLCQDSAGNMQDNIRVSGIKPTVTPSKISGAGSMTCTWAKLSTSDKFFTISSVSTSKYLFDFYYSDAHGDASISYYVTKNGSSSSYDVQAGDN